MENVPLSNEPLTPYRKEAKFDQKLMRICLYGERRIEYIDFVWSFLRGNRLFYPLSRNLTVDDQRELTQKRVKSLLDNKIMIKSTQLSQVPDLLSAWCEAVMSFDAATGSKIYLSHIIFPDIIRRLGSQRHEKYARAAENGEIVGCFAIEEVATDFDSDKMKTTATFNDKNDTYILNTPNFQAAKCWIDSLGQTATHAFLYARVIAYGGINCGLHPFIVPVRCSVSKKPFPGVFIGDIVEKVGLNGSDNGFLMFNNYQINSDALLGKMFSSQFLDSDYMLETESDGRILASCMAINNLQKAITIGVRSAAVRRRMISRKDNTEVAIIEFQHNQVNLMPYIAVTFASKIFYMWLSEENIKSTRNQDSFGQDFISERLDQLGEIHALSATFKSITSLMATNCLQICRELCGNHGYLRAAGIGDIREENDWISTFEGENSRLLQQTSDWLVDLLPFLQPGQPLSSSRDSIKFLKIFNKEKRWKLFIKNEFQATEPKFLIKTYEWLVNYLLYLTQEKIAETESRHCAQSFYGNVLSVAFLECNILKRFWSMVTTVKDPQCEGILRKLVSLYGAWNLEKHMSFLYMGGYFVDNYGQLIRNSIVDLCFNLKFESVALVDVISPPDFVLNSILGTSDGYIYKRLQAALYSSPGAFKKPNVNPVFNSKL